jgi:tetratricopeptide (TPR) repeat protein
VALEYYNKAIEIEQNIVLYSNRSVTYLFLNNFDNSLIDAEKCIEMDPKFSKVK